MYSGESQPVFWSDISLPFSASKSKPCKKHTTQYNSVHHAGVLIGLFFDPEVGNDMFLRNADVHQTTLRYIMEDKTLHNNLLENLKSFFRSSVLVLSLSSTDFSQKTSLS